MKTIRVSDVNLEAAKLKALQELKVNPDFVEFTEVDETTVDATVTITLEKLVEDYLANFFDECYISFEITTNKDENSIVFNIDTADNPLLIGREGKVLNALQFIIRHIAFLYSDEYQH